VTGHRPSIRVTRGPAVLAACLIAWSPVAPAHGYQKYGVRVGNETIILKWADLPIRYYVSDRSASGVSAEQFRAAIGRAFTTWSNAPRADLRVAFVGFTGAAPLDEDGISTLGFLARPDLDRVLGATDYLIDTLTGEILESDIFFNTAFPWSVADAGETGRYDLESIALHEIGHLLGLGHSALGETELVASGGRRVIAAEAVMFPIAFSAGNISDRVLKPDDIAGIGDLYPSAAFGSETGTLSGQVTKGGAGVFGAHVVAFNPRTGRLVGNFTYDDGRFAIGGLDPGPHILRVEPLDDAELESFFSDVGDVDLDFRVTYLERLAIVPAKGSATVQIAVERK